MIIVTVVEWRLCFIFFFSTFFRNELDMIQFEREEETKRWDR